MITPWPRNIVSLVTAIQCYSSQRPNKNNVMICKGEDQYLRLFYVYNSLISHHVEDVATRLAANDLFLLSNIQLASTGFAG